LEAAQVTQHSSPPVGAPAPARRTNGAAATSDGGLFSENTTVEVISFSIGDNQYGVPIMAVREIKGWAGATPLPHQPDYVRGVVDLRGTMVPIIDLRRRLGQGTTEATSTHIVIIVQVAERIVGLLADRVLDIVSFESTAIQPVPRVAHGSSADCLSGLVTTEDAMIAIVDLPKLLSMAGERADANPEELVPSAA
jgi:purine-binding chemotaxis protein CheW